ncbi:MAG: methyltransferase domain-containing protein [Kiloniellales bacterium]|nr:methyltransferase domain-containing protein [Kiloniellales bacterium]
MRKTDKFYNDLAPYYHLMFEDWNAVVRRQAEALGPLIARLAGPGPKRILDASCGIGTQAIGLALKGHAVTATDLSASAVARARREAARFGVEMTFGTADLREVDRSVPGPFDLVVSLDNALPHLESDRDLRRALAAVRTLLGADGFFLASVRDYDHLRQERPEGTPLAVYPEADGERRVRQTWDWWPDGEGYDFTLRIERRRVGKPETMVFTGRYRALRRAELNAALEASGFPDPTWLAPAETGFFQPIVAARPG